jgi:hypothetical protein
MLDLSLLLVVPCLVSGLHFGLWRRHDLAPNLHESGVRTLGRRDGWFTFHRLAFLPRRRCGFAALERWTFRQVMPGQRLVGQTTPDDGCSGLHEPLTVRHRAVVESVTLFVEIPEQVERFDRCVGDARRPKLFLGCA